MTDYRGLGFDPVPGSVEAVAAASARCTESADTADGIGPELRRAGELPHGWTGPARDAYADRLARVPSTLAGTSDELRSTARILDEWATVLGANRRTAEDLDRRAAPLRRGVRDAADEVERNSTTAQFATGPAAAHAAAEVESAQRRRDDLQARLDRVLDGAHALERDHRAEAERVAARLRAVASGGAAPEARPAATRFAGPAGALRDLSALGRELAGVLAPLGPEYASAQAASVPHAPPRGAADAFSAALAAAPGGGGPMLEFGRPDDGGR